MVHSWSLPFVLVLQLSICSSSLRARDPLFIVMMTERDASASEAALHDMYCLDPVLPSSDAACDYRVLAPVDGYFSDTRIESMSVDFEHPSKGTNCSIEWAKVGSDVNVTCEGGRKRFGDLPAFRAVNTTSGSVRASNLIHSEASCLSHVYRKLYYKMGLNFHSEQRSTVVFLFKTLNCRAGAIFGRPDIYRTTEAPCRYNARRRCRPVTTRQQEKAGEVIHLSRQ